MVLLCFACTEFGVSNISYFKHAYSSAFTDLILLPSSPCFSPSELE